MSDAAWAKFMAYVSAAGMSWPDIKDAPETHRQAVLDDISTLSVLETAAVAARWAKESSGGVDRRASAIDEQRAEKFHPLERVGNGYATTT